VVLCLGEPENDSGEGRSRTEVTLPGPQLALAEAVIRANPNTVVVLFNGRPLVLTELEKAAPAMLEMWYPGTEAGHAVARLLWGDANPCGKLSVGLPRTTGQYPMPYNRTNTGRPKPQPDTGVFPFSSSYLDTPNLPLYSFGHGLSYTSFSYEKLTLDKPSITKNDSLAVTVTVRNTGDRPGKEAVQLYMRDLVASVVRPVQQLIDYKKISLEPGEKKDVVFTVTEKQLRFWDFSCKEISEPGDFELSAGYADHLLLTQRFTLKA
jgi:beta-glucosidase